MKIPRDQMMTHFRYTWYIYFGIAAVAVGIWVMVFSGILRTKEYEKLTVFCATVLPQEDTIEEDMRTALIEQTGRRLDYVDIECYNIGAANGATVFQMRAASGTDMFILPESMIHDDPGQTYFASMDTDLIEKFAGSGVDFYYEGNKAYAVRLHSGDGSRFASYIPEGVDLTYYLFISGKSVNLGGMYNTKESNDFTLRAIAWLLEKVN